MTNSWLQYIDCFRSYYAHSYPRYTPTREWKKSQKKKRIEARRTGRFPKRRR